MASIMTILPGTGRGTTRFFSGWWRGSATSASPVEAPLHHPSDGPQLRVDRAPGTILDCWGQSNPTLRAGEEQA